MTLWNIIRDFFVVYVFGGYTSNGNLITVNAFGFISANEIGEQSVFTTDIGFNIGNVFESSNAMSFNGYVNLGDWLSTTATIITLVVLFIGISCLMVSLFRWIVRLVSLRG